MSHKYSQYQANRWDQFWMAASDKFRNDLDGIFINTAKLLKDIHASILPEHVKKVLERPLYQMTQMMQPHVKNAQYKQMYQNQLDLYWTDYLKNKFNQAQKKFANLHSIMTPEQVTLYRQYLKGIQDVVNRINSNMGDFKVLGAHLPEFQNIVVQLSQFTSQPDQAQSAYLQQQTSNEAPLESNQLSVSDQEASFVDGTNVRRYKLDELINPLTTSTLQQSDPILNILMNAVKKQMTWDQVEPFLIKGWLVVHGEPIPPARLESFKQYYQQEMGTTTPSTNDINVKPQSSTSATPNTMPNTTPQMQQPQANVSPQQPLPGQSVDVGTKKVLI